ncbi:MAG: type I restriction endonuclease subunit R [Ktedonobacteraceae bacterium]
MDTSEKNLEETIEQVLLSNEKSASPDSPESAVHQSRPLYGTATSNLAQDDVAPGSYHKRTSNDYDRAYCLIPEDVLNFIYATQPKEWEKFKRQYEADARKAFFLRLASEVRMRGTLNVLRKGIKANGCKFQLAYFQPSSGLNYEVLKLYSANFFSEVRQLRYSERNNNSLDLVLFLNGLPIFTAELKNPFTGQNVQNAIQQYRLDRDPREPLFAFGRCLAHFAVDPDLIYMTTHLDGPDTRFLPFNKGRNGGAGNPPSWKGFATAYLWENVWASNSVLNLVQHFIQEIENLDDKGKKTGKKSLIFPRFHQLDAVRRLVADAREQGPSKRYLIEHSAGSGKSNSISWLAHQLSVLHDAQDKRVFDSIIVITDRRILDRQLQQTVQQFEQTLGVVENIDTTSGQLKDALEGGKTIIVTTLQKFPVIVDQIGSLPGKRFAVIIDEAHSSQSGESTKSLKTVLTVGSLADADIEESAEGDDLEDRIAEEMRQRGNLPNVSYFAFTATPKPKTLELFGTRRADNKYEAFSLYTMRQAIEEHFILDVLENYTTYKTYWNLLKKIETDPHYDRTKATLLLKSFVDGHEQTIAKKVALMVEHFEGQVAHLIEGKAKAMIVTRSRLHAVRYKQAVERYLQEKGYPYKALVAFSGTLQDGGIDYTESHMNGFTETQTAETFKQHQYRILIVANKFQTGFDQPLLHTMYVDKKLGGVNAVQTLSRLNRTYPDKNETMVLDFVNEAEELQNAFAPYYEKTLLSEGTDPNLLYDLQTKLADFQFYSEAEVNRFAMLYFAAKETQDKLYAALEPIVERYKEALDGEKADFKGHFTDYVRLYAFLSQIITFVDTDLEKLYVFGRLLLRKLPSSLERLPVEIQQNIDIESYRIKQTSKGKITLPRGTTELEPIGAKEIYALGQDQFEPLSQIIQAMNEHFGTDFTEDDKLCIREIEQRLSGNAALEASVRVNPPENARLTFNHVVNDLLQDMIDGHFKFYKQVTDDPEFAKTFLDLLFARYLARPEKS